MVIYLFMNKERRKKNKNHVVLPSLKWISGRLAKLEISLFAVPLLFRVPVQMMMTIWLIIFWNFLFFSVRYKVSFVQQLRQQVKHRMLFTASIDNIQFGNRMPFQ